MATGKFSKKIFQEVLIIAIFLFLFPYILEAKTKLEVFVTAHTFLFILSLIGMMGFIVALLMLPSFLSQKFGREAKEMRRREELRKIPKGKIKNVDLSSASIYFMGRKGEIEKKNVYPDREFLIGKASTSCDLSIKDKGISWEHAKIRPEEEGYVLYDLSSKTGVKVNGKKIKKKKLENGDRIKIGRNILAFEFFPEKERRNYLRISFPLKCTLFSKSRKSFSGVGRDISLGGIKFESTAQLSPESVVEIQMEINEKPIQSLGIVRWIKLLEHKDEKKKYIVGVEFLEMPEKDRARLENFLSSQMIEEE